MTERTTYSESETMAAETADEVVQDPKRPYQAPSFEKKRSIHRVTLLSGMGVTGMGVLSQTT